MTSTLSGDFAQKARARIGEARAGLTALRSLGKQLSDLDKKFDADRARFDRQVSQLAEDVVDKLPEEAADADLTRAYALQEQLNDFVGDLEELKLRLSDDDLRLKDVVNEAYGSLRQAEALLSKLERLAAKLGI